MAQTPVNPAIPHTIPVDDTNRPTVSIVNPTDSSAVFAEGYVPSITTPIPTGAGGAETDPNKKRNTSFKITGILPSRPPSNSDDDDADESTVTEDDVPDTVPIHVVSTGNGISAVNVEAPRANPRTNTSPAGMQTENSNVEQKTVLQHIPTVPSSNITADVASTITNSLLGSQVGQRRNSQQVVGASKGSGVGGSGMLPSIRTGMALGYRFNIFVYDHKLGSGFDTHRTPASQVRATAASIFVQLTDGTANDGGIKTKSEQSGIKPPKGQEPTSNESVSDDLPFLQIQGKGSRPPESLFEVESKSNNTSSVLAALSTSTSAGTNPGNQMGEKHGPQDRFKVVKIETVVAKEIGRWTLVDYANRSAPVMPSNPSYFPAHISPAMSLTTGGKTLLKSALKSSTTKPSQQPAQTQSILASSQAPNVKNIPVIFNLQTKQQQFVPVSEPSKLAPSAITESSVVSKMQDTLPTQQPSTNKAPTTTSNIPHAIQASPSAILPGLPWIPQHANTGNPVTVSIQSTQQVRDGSPGLDVRVLPQPLSSGASNIQILDISTKKHESIAQQQQQQQHSAVQNLQRQSKSPAQYMDVTSCHGVQNPAPSHITVLAPQQQQTMQQLHPHLGHPQLPKLNTSCNSSTVQPSHVNVVSPLATDQVMAKSTVAQQMTKVHHDQQSVVVEPTNRNISQGQHTQTMELTQQYPVQGGDVSFQNQQQSMSTSGMAKEGALNIQSAPLQGGLTTLPQSALQNQSSVSASMQSHQSSHSIQPGGQDYPPTLQPMNMVVELSQSIQQQSNVQQIAQPPKQSLIPQQNMAMINLQQHGAMVQQQFPEQNNMQIRTSLEQSQQNPIVTNMVNPHTNVQHQATNQDQHMQTVRIMPNQPSQQISGDMIHAKVYVANQGSSGNVSEIHSSQVIQQNLQPVLQTAVSVSSTGQVPLQQQTPIQMQGGMSNYIPHDPNLSIRQIHQQSTAPQSQQSNQTRQFIQQQSQIQALSSHQAQQQPNQTHQMQHPPIIQHQQSHMLQASQIAQQQSSNTIPASGTHQHPTQQTVLVQHFQQANINNQQTTNSVTTHDQQPNSEISQRFDQGTLASKSVPYTLAGGQSICSNTVASSIQHSIQHTAGPLPVKQPLIGGTVVQPSSRESVNSSLPPSRPDPSVATYSNISATGLNLPQQISGATTQIEKVNLVNAQQIIASTSQHVPLDDAGSIENKKTNVGEQLMDRLEQISRTQGNWATTTVDGVDSESQEISALTKQFPASMIQEKEILEGFTNNQMTQGSSLGHGSTSESVQLSDSVQTDSNSPVSVFKPILPNTSEEGTLSPTQCSASGTNHGAIDNRIEQAMDLVKSHLMNAVRSEVEELKEKIIRLEDTIINLQSENEVLKMNVPNDVLRQISNTTTPLLAVQQQPMVSTAYSTVAVNPSLQQQPTVALPIVSTGVTSTVLAPMNTANLGTTHVINSSNPPNTNSGVNQGIGNTSSQIPPTYMPQTTGTQGPPVTPKPPQ